MVVNNIFLFSILLLRVCHLQFPQSSVIPISFFKSFSSTEFLMHVFFVLETVFPFPVFTLTTNGVYFWGIFLSTFSLLVHSILMHDSPGFSLLITLFASSLVFSLFSSYCSIILWNICFFVLFRRFLFQNIPRNARVTVFHILILLVISCHHRDLTQKFNSYIFNQLGEDSF